MIHYAASEASSQTVGGLCSCFLDLKPASVHVRRWCAQTETLEMLQEDEEERYARGVRSFSFDEQVRLLFDCQCQ